MARNPVGFQVTDAAAGWNGADFDDLFIRKDCFLDGGLWLWGNNIQGAVGTNDIINRSSPVQTVSGGTNWKSVSSTSNGQFRAAIKTDGTLWTWGYNTQGHLGDNTVIFRSSPVQTISGGTNWKSISIGTLRGMAAIKTDGSLWLWGAGLRGQLGNNNEIYRSSPVQTVSGGTGWKSVSMGQGLVAAIKTDGTLWTWGCNLAGGLGNNNSIYRSSPVQTISGGTNWKQASAGNRFVAAIKTDGTLWTWGTNDDGNLGTDNIISRSSPVQTVSAGTNWKTVSTGTNTNDNSMAGIKTDGSLWLWGRNSQGQLGNDTIINRSSPVQTVSGGTNWKSISINSTAGSAIKTDGTLWTWGAGSNLGDNSIINKSSPVQTVSSGTNWRFISGNSAIREACW